jgi:Holliday junction resolvase YEN1
VFDGRERPKVKRGSKMGKAGSHNLTDSMKKLLDIFGMEWRMVGTV